MAFLLELFFELLLLLFFDIDLEGTVILFRDTQSLLNSLNLNIKNYESY